MLEPGKRSATAGFADATAAWQEIDAALVRSRQ
jgi:hypothetical protein